MYMNRLLFVKSILCYSCDLSGFNLAYSWSLIILCKSWMCGSRCLKCCPDSCLDCAPGLRRYLIRPGTSAGGGCLARLHFFCPGLICSSPAGCRPSCCLSIGHRHLGLVDLPFVLSISLSLPCDLLNQHSRCSCASAAS